MAEVIREEARGDSVVTPAVDTEWVGVEVEEVAEATTAGDTVAPRDKGVAVEAPVLVKLPPDPLQLV